MPLKVSILDGATGDPRGIRELGARYIEWLKVTNHSLHTARGREHQLCKFALWCEERQLTLAHEITKPIIDRYQRYLFHYRKVNGLPLGTRSQIVLLVSVKMFFKWCVRSNHLLYNPASEIELPRKPRHLPHVLTTDEVESVLRQPDTSKLGGVRDRALLETLYSTGVRRKELVELTVNSLDFNRGVLMVRQGKGLKDRVVPIGDRALSWVKRYLDDARPRLAVEPDDGTLFLTPDGRPYSVANMGRIVREHLNAAGIEKRGSCHLFRHSMATAMLENGADVRYIQEMLGHADLNSTQIYTHVSIRKLKEIHNATHPAARRALGAAAMPPAPATDLDKVADLKAALDVEGDEEDATL